MKPLLIVTLLSLLITGCGQSSTRSAYIDQEFEPYIAELQTMALEYTKQDLIIPSSIVFGDLGNMLRGICKNEENTIVIDQGFWDANKLESQRGARLAVLLHEIGHCSYERGHDSKLGESSIWQPTSIMMSTQPGHFDEFQELFFHELLEL